MNTPQEITEIFAALGAKKTQTPKERLFSLAVLAGMFIALAGVGSTVAGAAVNKLAGACVFPAGLVMVVLAGSELFTGDCLMIISALGKRISVGKMLTVLLIVYCGNFLGAWLVALLASMGGTLDSVHEAVISAAAAKASLGFGAAFVRGVLCNVLVCLAVWLAAAAKEPVGKIAGIFFPIMLFVLCGYEHCVANMYYLPAGLLTSAKLGVAAEGLAWSGLWRNLVPVTLGNIVGGMGVGACYWAIYLRGRGDPQGGSGERS